MKYHQTRITCYITLTGTLKHNIITGAITMNRNDGAPGTPDDTIFISIPIKHLY
ncbi:hypothetical protein [Chitinophaga polysaccharea]|uniref:hypothetical protein n=1 Tax=Chitinophaga polysaccharea TaxID=1293035 RepID=UPI00163BD27A|nr:hypothetical protein [Chitinophaga polysaccharea]